MKRKIFFIISLVVISLAFTACDVINSDCEVCRYKYEDITNGSANYSEETEYCGTDLVVMKATKPKTVGNIKTSVECY